MSKYIAVKMPEQEEGKESGVVCLVKNASLENVKELVFGKGFGVQGHDDGVDVYGCDDIDGLIYIVPILCLDDFKHALEDGQLNWYNVVEWQRWQKGYVKCKEKIIVLNSENVEISKCFEQCGYQISI
jgi:hypothetical protein